MAQQLPVTYHFELRPSEVRPPDAFEWCTYDGPCREGDPKRWVLEASPDRNYWTRVASSEDAEDWFDKIPNKKSGDRQADQGREVCSGPLAFVHTPAPTALPPQRS